MQKDRLSFHPHFVNTVIAFGVVECASGLAATFLLWIAYLGTHLNMLAVQLVMLAVSIILMGINLESCNYISIAIRNYGCGRESNVYLVTGVSALSSSENSNWTTLAPITTTVSTTTTTTLAPTTSSSTQVYRSKLMTE